MPFSFPLQIEHKPLTLGEVLDGDRMAKSQYELKFKGLYTSDPSQKKSVPSVGLISYLPKLFLVYLKST